MHCLITLRVITQFPRSPFLAPLKSLWSITTNALPKRPGMTLIYTDHLKQLTLMFCYIYYLYKVYLSE